MGFHRGRSGVQPGVVTCGCCKTKVRSFIESACRTVLKPPASTWCCFIEKAKLLCFCLPKENTTRNHVYITFIMGFMFLSRRSGRTRHHNMLRGITFPSHAWGIQPITTRWIAGQSQHSSLFRWAFLKIDAFQKVGHRGETIMYSMWKIMCFLTLNLINTFHYTKYTK